MKKSLSTLLVTLSLLLFAGCGGSSTKTTPSTQNPTDDKQEITQNSSVNQAPIATFSKFAISRDVSYDGQLNATDADGDTLKYVIVTQPQHGSVVLHDNGCFTYTPNSGYQGSDTFSYRASDDVSSCAVKTVTVDVNAPTIQKPTAPSNLTVTALSSTSLKLTWNDNSKNEEGFVIYKDGKPICTTTANVTHFTVSCGLNAETTYNFEVKAKNEAGTSTPASAQGTIKDVITKPATPTELKVKSKDETSIRLSWKDNANNESSYEIYQDGIHIKSVSSKCNCTLILNLDSCKEYTFEVRAKNKIDESGGDTLVVKTEGCVIVSINHAPTATPQSVTMDEDTTKVITLSETDPENSPLTYTVVTPPTHGTFTDGIYTPNPNYNGSDSFSFTANDGTLTSAPATVSITINDVAEPNPVVVNITDDILCNSVIAEGNVTFTFDFSREVTDFDIDDISITGGEILKLENNVTKSYLTVKAGNSEDEKIVIKLAKNSIHDSEGNTNTSIVTAEQLIDDGKSFITTWKTDNEGLSEDNQILITTKGDGYDYEVDWCDGTIDTHVDGNITHTFATNGVKTVKISGDFPRIYFEGVWTSSAGSPGYITSYFDNFKILSVEQWGKIKWKSMENAFIGAVNINIKAKDNPDLSNVLSTKNMFKYFGFYWKIANIANIDSWNMSNIKNMNGMFYKSMFNQDISSWDTSNVTDMSNMFSFTYIFNQPIGNWDVSKVSNMANMFHSAYPFNQQIGNWDVSSVTNMSNMFNYAYKFDQDIRNWDVSNVTNMEAMFRETKFNQDINNWDTSKVTDMNYMFYDNNYFNQDINNWDTSKVTDMNHMFWDADKFNNHDLSGWDVSKVENHKSFFNAGSGNIEPNW